VASQYEAQDARDGDVARVRRERDLYRQLTLLGEQADLESFLVDALAAIVEITAAAHGLLEIYEDRDASGQRRWFAKHQLLDDQVESVRVAVSRGIIAQALAGGTTVVTASALLDPRFRERDSVRVGRIEEVLCAPVGDCPTRGVLYLQGRVCDGPFTADDRQVTEIFARHLGPIVERLLVREREQAGGDPTRAVRRRLRCERLVGRSHALARMLDQLASVAPLDVTVLLTGRSGTGKSLVARLIHENSARRTGAFVEINCAALPEHLVESELFGAVPGAHSTAARRIDGKVAAADHGTLLLDEVSELPLSAQAKLLQLLQSRSYYPLGSNRPSSTDVRVVAATNADLERAVAEKRFRPDLYYRLHVVPIRVPSLDERRDDVDELAIAFCAHAVARHGLSSVSLSAQAIRTLRAMEWPGHVRQLEHAVEAAAIRAASTGASQVEPSHLTGAGQGAHAGSMPTFQEATRRFQSELVRQVLEDSGWNVVEAARRLDVARSHLYNLIRAFGLERAKR
jgi:Nif-specific regulatory protein